MMTNEELILWNARGLIPGPDENDESFFERVLLCLSLQTIPPKERPEECAEMVDAITHHRLLQEIASKTSFLFGIELDWVPISFKNSGLAPWHGGCAWIIPWRGTFTACFQLRKAFATQTTYLKLYHRGELLAHEAAHVGRMAFEEPKFEEILAYRTATTGFRRWFGPIVQSSREVLFFMFTILLSFFFDIAAIMTEDETIVSTAFWAKGIPLLFVLFGIQRLAVRHLQLQRCLNKLQRLVGNKGGAAIANALCYRLTDEEIIRFGSLTLEEVQREIEAIKESSLRWKVIFEAYLKS